MSASNPSSRRPKRKSSLVGRIARLFRPLGFRRLGFESLEERRLLATVTVNDPTDTLDNPTSVTVGTLGSSVTLRDAINAADNSGGSNTIVLGSGVTYDFTTVDNNWYGPNALPPIAADITIVGNGSTLERDSSLPQDTGDAFRFFYVSGGISNELPIGTLTLENLTLTNGLAKGGDAFQGGGGLGAGGAIFNQGNLTVSGVTLNNNMAIGGSFNTFVGNGGGGMGQDSPGNDGGGFGGSFSVGSYGGTGGSGNVGSGGGGGGFTDDASGPDGGGQSEFGGSGLGYTNDGEGGSGAATGDPGASGGDFGAGGGGSSVDGGGGGVGGGGGAGLAGGGGGFGGGGGLGSQDGAGNGGFGAGGGGNGGSGGSNGLGGFGGGNARIGGGGGAGMGGAIFSMFGSVNIVSSTLAYNTAQGGNSQFFGELGQGGSGLGGAIFNLDGAVSLTFATIANNSVVAGQGDLGNGTADGGGIYSLAYGNDYTSGVSVSTSLAYIDSIVADNLGDTSDLVSQEIDGANVSNTGNAASATSTGPNIVPTSSAVNYGNNGTATYTSTGVLTADPGLSSVTLTSNTGYPATLNLPSNSPAIAAGTLAGTFLTSFTDEVGTPLTTLPSLGAWQQPVSPQCYTICVNDTSDQLDNPTDVTYDTLGATVSLRDAINAANNTGGNATIVLGCGATYDFTTADNNWYGPNALPPIASNITIFGNGSTLQRDSSLPQDTADAFRFFYVSGGISTELPLGTLVLKNLTLTNGLAKGGDSGMGGGGLGAGGAIFNQGNLTLDGVTLDSNEALGGSAVGSVSSSSSGGGGMGQDGQGNSDGGGFGGSFATGSYGGLGGAGSEGAGPGFEIYYGGGGGGFAANANGTSGGGQSGLADGGSDGGGTGESVGNVAGESPASGGSFGQGGFSSSTTAGGSGGVGAGGAFVGNGGFGGGGGGLGDGGFGGGGGLYGNGGFGGGSDSNGDVGGGGAGLGGAVFSMFGSLTVINSTLTNNIAQGGDSIDSQNPGNGGSGGSGFGGAIFNLNGTVSLTFATIANNTVVAGQGDSGSGFADGGALYNLSDGNNYASGSAISSPVTLINSILSGSVDATGGGNQIATDLITQEIDGGNGNNTGNAASVTSAGPNIVILSTNAGGGPNGTSTFDPTGLITGVTNSNLGLSSTLSANGGYPATLNLLSGSAAIGVGIATGGITRDERGLPRSYNSVYDLGAAQDQGFETFADASSTLNLGLLATSQVMIISTGTSYRFTLASGALWTGTDDSNIAGNATGVLTVTSAGIGAFTSGIDASDSGGVGGETVLFGNSQASAYFNSFSFDLSSAFELAFLGATTMAGTSSLSATVGGWVVLDPNAMLTMSTGSLTLASTGSNSNLWDIGNILSQGGAVTLQSTGNVRIESDTDINATSGPITLAADVTASGAGDDGVGTLAIGSGAQVTTSGAIKLRGAQTDIDTSAYPAVVGGTFAMQTTAVGGYSVGNSPASLAIDSVGELYVANSSDNTVEVFAPQSTLLLATYSTGLAAPRALAIDSDDNLYVANYGNNTVEEFARGSTVPVFTYSTGMDNPDALALDSLGDLYVADFTNSTVEEFSQQSSTPNLILNALNADINQPTQLALDAAGNLYVDNEGADDVEEFAPGSTTPTVYSTGLDDPRAMAFDAAGNLYVANFAGNTVEKFAPGNTNPSATYTASISNPTSLAFDPLGNLYVANAGNDTIEEFAPGATTPIATLSNGTDAPTVLIFDSLSDLYVDNEAANTVNVFIPGNMATPSAEQVTIQSSIESRPMQLGGSSLVNGINLTNAEFAQIFTTSTGTLTVGDPMQTGNITFNAATPVTTSGATLNLVQDTTGAGQIILDDDGGAATALSGNGGSITLTAGTGGIAADSANNNVAEIATTGATITLLTTGPIGSSTNRIQFADNSNYSQQVVTVGSSTLQPSSAYLDGLGSLTLGSIAGSSSNPMINVTARNNLVVKSGATINAGSGPIVLGADLTAAEASGATTGSLTIASGATVTTSSDILLAGDGVSSDGNVAAGGTLWINSAGSVTQSSPISATNLSIAASGIVALTNSNNAVTGKVAIHDAAIGAYVEWLDSDGFEVGSIAAASATDDPQGIFGTVSGVSATGNFIALENTSGNMTLGDGGSGEGVTAAGAGGDVRLQSAGAITQNSAGGAISSSALGVVAHGNVELSQTPNTAMLLSINDSSGYVRFVDSEGFTVGTVGGLAGGTIFPNAVHGVTTVGSDIGLQSNAGSLILGSGNSNEVVSATGVGGDVRLESAAGIQQVSGSGAITAGALGIVAHGNVDLSEAVNTVLLVSINNSSGYVRLVNSQTFTVGTVGGVTANIFPSAVHGITTVGGDIGLKTTNGDMILGNGNASEIISATGAGGDVRLNSNGEILQNSSAGGAITAGALGIIAHGNVDLTESPNSVIVLSAQDTSGYVRFVNSRSLAVGSVGPAGTVFSTAIHGVTTVNGDIALQTNAGSLQLGTGASSEVVSATGTGSDVRLESAGAVYQSPGSGAITASAFGVVASGIIQLNLVTNYVSAILAIDDDAAGAVVFSNSLPYAEGTVGRISAKIFPNSITGVTTVTPNPSL